MKTIMSFTLSQGVVNWLIEKKKESINISGFVNQILEEKRIKELESDENS